MNRIESGGTANYNGLVLSLQRRPVKGVGFSANYTWSHCISDYYLDIANSGNANAGWTDPNNRRYDRGNCTGGAEDRRHLFNLSGTAASPQFSNRTLRLLGTGWQLAPIFRIMSGQALVIGDTTDPGLIFISPQRPNVTGDPYGDGSITNYLNVKAFSKASPRHARHSESWGDFWSGKVPVRRRALERFPVQGIAESAVPGGGVQPHEQLPEGQPDDGFQQSPHSDR